MPISAPDLAALAKVSLDDYLRNIPVDQIATERPLLKKLMEGRKMFLGARQNIVENKDIARNVEIQDRAAGTYVQEQANAKPIYQRITVEVDKIVERPVYRDHCFDADGLRQLGAAIAGRDAESGAGQPVPAAR